MVKLTKSLWHKCKDVGQCKYSNFSHISPFAVTGQIQTARNFEIETKLILLNN
jgi:hypothetical protein